MGKILDIIKTKDVKDIEDHLSSELKNKESEILRLTFKDCVNGVKIKELTYRLSDKEIEVEESLPSICIAKETYIYKKIRDNVHNSFIPGSDSSMDGCR